MNKKELRAEIRAKRSQLKEAIYRENSDRICMSIINSEAYFNAEVLLAYMPIKGEVDITELILRALEDGKAVGVPRVNGNTMDFYRITSLNELETGYMGIPEPKKDAPIIECKSALMIMPGTAFDLYMHRCGYGGGFYDRYCEKYPGLNKLAVAFEFQIYDSIPYEDTDICPNLIVTEERTICNGFKDIRTEG